MDEKDLAQQLKELKNIRLSEEKRKDSRVKLLMHLESSQIETDLNSEKIMLPIRWLRTVSQPAMAAFLIIMIIFGGGVLSLRAARDTKPGDSLYIAKIINEKTQLVLTFNEKKKVRLGLEFAGNRAKELKLVLNEEDASQERQEKIESLKNKFKREINYAKDQLARFQAKDRESEEEISHLETTNENLALEEKQDTEEPGGQLFTANLGRDEKGIEVSGGEESQTTIQTEDEPVIPTEEVATETSTDETILTESNEESSSATTSELSDEIPVEDTETQSAETIIDQVGEQVEELLQSEDLSQDDLSELAEAIDQVNLGEVKGESEAATSSPAAPEEANPQEEDDQGEVLGVEEQATTSEE
jgi:hypothetical protein